MKSAVVQRFMSASLCVAGMVAASSHEVLSRSQVAQPAADRQTAPAGAIPLGDTPGQWVPFSARTIRVFPNGNAFAGVFYRSSDGSTRSETGPPNGEIDSIAINNKLEKTLHVWAPDRGWESHPIHLPSGKYIQPMPDGTFGDRRIVERLEGIDLITMPPEPDGMVRFMAPHLNYFEVKMLQPCTNPGATPCGFWMSDIQVGEQPEELFKPPSK